MIHTVVVCKDAQLRNQFARVCANCNGVKLVGIVSNAQEAKNLCHTVRIDMAIIEIELEDQSGLELSLYLQQQNTTFVPILASSTERHAMQAHRLGAAGYLVMPTCNSEVRKVMWRGCCLCSGAGEGRVYVQVRTFGHFDVFVNGRPMRFFRRKSKELLAYLVDRQGGFVTVEQIAAALWEGRPYDEATRANYQVAFKDLRKDLQREGIEDILVSERNQKAVNTLRFDCDYYRLLGGEPIAAHLFFNQYMVDYSWAEETTACCIRLKDAILAQRGVFL